MNTDFKLAENAEESIMSDRRKDFPLVKLSEIANIVTLKNREQVKEGSLILRRVGNFKIVNADYLASISDTTLRNYFLLQFYKAVNMDYIRSTLKGPIIQKQLSKMYKGTVLLTISILDLKNLLVPLPSLEEQNRIARDICESTSR